MGGLALAYVVVLSAEAGRGFFQLAALPAEIVVTLAVIAGVWTWAVLHIHRTRIVQRAIDVLILAWQHARAVSPSHTPDRADPPRRRPDRATVRTHRRSDEASPIGSTVRR